jgi:hypothetical protein
MAIDIHLFSTADSMLFAKLKVWTVDIKQSTNDRLLIVLKRELRFLFVAAVCLFTQQQQ